MTVWVVGVLGKGLVDPSAPLLPVDDLGLQRGDGCFETVLVRRLPGEDEPVAAHLDAHLDRLGRSATRLDLPPVDEAAWRALLREVVGAGADRVASEAVLKLVLTRGTPGAGPPAPTALATLGPVPAVAVTQRTTGVSVVTLDTGVVPGAHARASWLLGGVKTLSYAVNMSALREAARRGADDAILLAADGTVLEAPTATVLWLSRGRLSTTPTDGTGVLPGTTQQAIFAAAPAAGLDTGYDAVTAAGLAGAEAVWLASAVRGLTPVRMLDGRPVRGRPDLTATLAPVALGVPPTSREAVVPAASPSP
jgi:4-amino-4-deoxychorismate lyase